MANKINKLMIVSLLCVAMLCVTTSSAQSTSNTCTSSEFDLMSCTDYVKGDATTPSSTCCSQFSKIVSSVPDCLCTVKPSNGGPGEVLGINTDRASKLPELCNVKMPSTVSCNPTALWSTGSSPPSPTTPAGGAWRTTSSITWIISVIFAIIFQVM